MCLATEAGERFFPSFLFLLIKGHDVQQLKQELHLKEDGFQFYLSTNQAESTGLFASNLIC